MELLNDLILVGEWNGYIEIIDKKGEIVLSEGLPGYGSIFLIKKTSK